jgi:hypothetical protein
LFEEVFDLFCGIRFDAGKQMNTKISKTVTVEDLTTKFKTMVTKEFLTTTIEKVKDEIKDMMNEKIDKLESRIFDLELSN